MVTAQTLATLRNFAKAGLIGQDDADAILQALQGADAGTPVLLTAKETARRLDSCVKTVHRLAADGRLPRIYLRPGKAKSLRFRESDVSAIVSGAPAPVEG